MGHKLLDAGTPRLSLSPSATASVSSGKTTASACTGETAASMSAGESSASPKRLRATDAAAER